MYQIKIYYKNKLDRVFTTFNKAKAFSTFYENAYSIYDEVLEKDGKVIATSTLKDAINRVYII